MKSIDDNGRQDRIRILLVDDEQELVDTLAQRLELRGFDPIRAVSGYEAMEAAGKYSIPLALLDMKMPTMDGPSLQKELSRMQPAMRFIFLSGHGPEAIADSNVRDKGIRFLVKPVSISELLSTMNELLQERDSNG